MNFQLPLLRLVVGMVFLTSPLGLAVGQEPNGSMTGSNPRQGTNGAMTGPAVRHCPLDICPPGTCSLIQCLSFRRLARNNRYVPRDLPPPGSSLHAMHFTQVGNAAEARMMLYNFDFLPNDTRLNPRGTWQLTKLTTRMQYHGFPILIESTTSRELDEGRRAHVLAALADASVGVDPEQVLIAQPLTRGIDGLDAMEIHSGMLRMSAGGSMGGVGPGSAGGMGGGGGGGPGGAQSPAR